ASAPIGVIKNPHFFFLKSTSALPKRKRRKSSYSLYRKCGFTSKIVKKNSKSMQWISSYTKLGAIKEKKKQGLIYN
ncbi:MAG: hypothetical protein ACLSWV_00700, partial [Pygmaiobacter massiliensis]